jgi:hypothetical protein
LGSGRTRWSATWKVIRLLLGLSLAGFIVSQASLGDLASLWKQVSIPWLAGVLLTFVAGCWLIARRYWLLLGRRPDFHALLQVVLLQIVLGNLFATGAGVASYVVGLRAEHQVQAGRSIASLVLARLGDLLCLLVSLLVTSVLLWTRIENLHWLFWFGLAATVSCVAAGAALVLFRRQFVSGINWLLLQLGHRPSALPWGLSALLAAWSAMEPEQWCHLLLVAASHSFLIFVLSCISFYSGLRVFAVPAGVLNCVYVVSVTQLVMLIPVHVFGGLGVTDLTTIYLLAMLGLDRVGLPSLAIGLRLIFYGANLVLIGFLAIPPLITRHRGQAPGEA